MLNKRLAIPLVVALSLVLVAGGVAYADLKVISVVDGWDEGSNPQKYAHSLNLVVFDGDWLSFLHQLDFDKDQYVQTNPAYPAVACPAYPTRTTPWAGVMEFGLGHVDNAPLGAAGWQQSRDWQLVACDRNGDGKFDGDDLKVQPMDYVVPYAGGTLTVITKDLEVACSTGNCSTEIVTTIFINTDSDCDGRQNTDIPAGGLCFYAEAETPVEIAGSPLLWGGNLQTRISSGGGDKTVNYDVEGMPVGTAITLSSFTAKSAENGSLPVSLGVVTGVLGVAAAGAVGWRRRRSG